MLNVSLIFKGVETIIQCNIKEQIKKLNKKYEVKTGQNISELYLIYNANILNQNLTFNDVINEEDRKSNTMRILIDEDNKAILKEKIKKSKEIICPKCHENIFVEINEYKINLFNCKKNHNKNDILLKEFENLQNIDISKIKCNECKNKNMSETYNNTFYKCISCKKNLCPLCKSNHEQNHEIIKYNKKNYICEKHNNYFVKYCEDCKSNLCLFCGKEHKQHSIVELGDIILAKKDIIKEANELNEYINKFNSNIDDLTKKLNEVKDNINIYYNIYNNLIINYNNENLNYEVLSNINEFRKYNNIVIKDINKIVNESNLINKFIDIMKISNKMNNNTLNDNNNIFEQIDEIELLGKERPENIFEQIDEIEILGKEQPENIFEHNR